MSEAWFRPTAKNYQCPASDHPKPPRELVKLLARHTHMSEPNARHLLDRLRHITHCCREPESITLMRLLPGSKQTVQPSTLQLEAIDAAEQREKLQP